MRSRDHEITRSPWRKNRSLRYQSAFEIRSDLQSLKRDSTLGQVSTESALAAQASAPVPAAWATLGVVALAMGGAFYRSRVEWSGIRH